MFALEEPSNGAGEPAEQNGGASNGAEAADEKAENEDAKAEESNDTANAEEANADENIAEETAEAVSANTDVKPTTVRYKKMKINDLILSFTVLDGDEEKEYWQKVRKIVSGQKQKQHQNNRRFNNKGRGGGRFNHPFKKRGASDDKNNAKRAKVDN